MYQSSLEIFILPLPILDYNSCHLNGSSAFLGHLDLISCIDLVSDNYNWS